jgi:flagellar hook-associated protein 3 FlgL
MRISTNTIYQAGTQRMDDLQSSIAKLQQQISSGNRILTPADDPIAAARVLTVTQSQSMNTQYTTNRQSANNTLSSEESTLQSVTSLLQDVKTSVVQAGDGTLSDSDRKMIANTLSGQLTQLIGLANTQDSSGNYLFAGFQTNSQPFTASSTGATYLGDQGQRLVQTGTNSQISLGDSGSVVFEDNKTGNGVFTTAAASIAVASAANSSNTGTGVISVGAVTDTSQLTGHTYSIDFAAGGGSYSVYDTTLDPTKSGTPVTTGTYTSGQPIAFDGLQYNITGTPAGGDGFTVKPSGTIMPTNTGTGVISIGTVTDATKLTGDTYSVDFAPGGGTYNVYDTTLDPTKSGTPVATGTYASGQPIAFDGLQFNITGTPAGGDSFTVTPSGTQSIFTTLQNLINVLNTSTATSSGTTNLANGLATANNNLDRALENVLSVRATIGSRLNELDQLDSMGSGIDTQDSTTISNLQGVDYTQAISNLTEQQTTLTAAQQSFAKTSNLSLFNYL